MCIRDSHHPGVLLNIPVMAADVPLAHHQAAVPDLLAVLRRKIFFPIKGDVASLHNEVLSVFDGGFDDLPHHRPQIICQFPVAAHRGERCISASDQAHFQMVNGKIRISVFFQKLLRKGGFPRCLLYTSRCV